ALEPIREGFARATVLLAYEPVWAIGEGGTPASPDYADARHARIMGVAREVCPGHDIACLYGGSVNPGNCAELAACPNIDGLFIGRSAWNAAGYLDILGRVTALESA
ncbi:triose-phosphate isomerase, partial [Endobacter medicaginis]